MQNHRFQEHYQLYPALVNAVKDLSLSNKSVLITGGGSGVGFEIAKAFADRSTAHIIFVGRTESRLAQAAKALAHFQKTTVTYHVADITSEEDVSRVFKSLEQSPDFLVNSAGYMSKLDNFLDADLKEYWAAFEINILGTAIVTQTYLRHRAAKVTGDVQPALVFTLNTAGAYGPRLPRLSSYSASKAGVARWSECIAVDFDEKIARFVSVHPGAVQSDMLAKSELGSFLTITDGKLTGDFVVWLTKEEAQFLSGRFVWVNWDIQQLLDRKDDIVSRDLFRTSLSE